MSHFNFVKFLRIPCFKFQINDLLQSGSSNFLFVWNCGYKFYIQKVSLQYVLWCGVAGQSSEKMFLNRTDRYETSHSSFDVLHFSLDTQQCQHYYQEQEFQNIQKAILIWKYKSIPLYIYSNKSLLFKIKKNLQKVKIINL